MLQNSKYNIRKSAIVVNTPDPALFPKNGYYNLKDIMEDIINNNFNVSGYVPLTPTESVIISTNDAFSIKGTNDIVGLSTSHAKPGKVFLQQSIGTASRAEVGIQDMTGTQVIGIGHVNLLDANVKSDIAVTPSSVITSVSSDASTQVTKVTVEDEKVELIYDDHLPSTSSLAVEKDRISGLAKSTLFKYNEATGDLDFFTRLDSDGFIAAVESDGVASASSEVSLNGFYAEYSDAVVPANNSELTVGSGNIQLSAAKITIGTVTEYADDTAAGVGGLTAGDIYHTAGVLKIKL